MVFGSVILEPDGADFVTSHTGADLALSGVSELAGAISIEFLIEDRHQGVFGLSHVGLPRSAARFLFQSCGYVDNPSTIMVLVRVLTTRAKGLEPLNAKIVVAALLEERIASVLRFENSYGDTGGMDASTAFGWRYALNAMSACLFDEAGEIVTSNLYGDFLNTAIGRAFTDGTVLSTLAYEKSFVGAREITHE